MNHPLVSYLIKDKTKKKLFMFLKMKKFGLFKDGIHIRIYQLWIDFLIKRNQQTTTYRKKNTYDHIILVK